VRLVRTFSVCVDAGAFVIAGLDPAIHRFELSILMDARVKPAHDDSTQVDHALVFVITGPARSAETS
jgi:hypothetical protein